MVHGALGVWLNLSTAQEIGKRVKSSLDALEINQDITRRLRFVLIGAALCVLLGFYAASMAYERGFAAGWQGARVPSKKRPVEKDRSDSLCRRRIRGRRIRSRPRCPMAWINAENKLARIKAAIDGVARKAKKAKKS